MGRKTSPPRYSLVLIKSLSDHCQLERKCVIEEAFFILPRTHGFLPVYKGLGCIVQQLRPDTSADSGVAAALDFNQCGNAVLIKKEMVKRPSA